jgi:hypothetical protein
VTQNGSLQKIRRIHRAIVNFGEEIIIPFCTVLVGNFKKTMFGNPFGASVAENVKKRTVIVIPIVGPKGWW